MLGGGLVIARQRVPADIDAGRDDQPVIRQSFVPSASVTARDCGSTAVALCAANSTPAARSLS